MLFRHQVSLFANVVFVLAKQPRNRSKTGDETVSQEDGRKFL